MAGRGWVTCLPLVSLRTPVSEVTQGLLFQLLLFLFIFFFLPSRSYFFLAYHCFDFFLPFFWLPRFFHLTRFDLTFHVLSSRYPPLSLPLILPIPTLPPSALPPLNAPHKSTQNYDVGRCIPQNVTRTARPTSEAK